MPVFDAPFAGGFVGQESGRAAADEETIVALVTPPGRGGVGIVRVSGGQAASVARAVLGTLPRPRYAEYRPFFDERQQVVDRGIALWFPGPHSFTGEDVLELQGHGGPVVLDLLVRHVLTVAGVRVAEPGEFSRRAFLNDKLDLLQAEAIADLIDASSEQAARCALNSLQGVFSGRIHQLVEGLVQLRSYIEAAIDFPDEELDLLADGGIASRLEALVAEVAAVVAEARQGSLLREGMKVVIAGRPNAGKSSLLNALAGRDAAIVTAIAGTTRDVLREQVYVEGVPLHVIDTAGLREASDQVEQIGIERAWQEIDQADRVLLLTDASDTPPGAVGHLDAALAARLPAGLPVTLIRNKIDLTGEAPGVSLQGEQTVVRLSAQTGAGLAALREHLKQVMGFTGTSESGFLARRRHLQALGRADGHLQQARAQLTARASELLAEELRLAQHCLGEITGEFTADDLLGRIFSSFCIGK